MSTASTETLRRPNTRDENWRYANLRALERIPFESGTVVHGELDPATVPQRLASRRVVLVDGIYNASLSDELPAGVSVKTADSTAVPNDQSNSIDRYFSLLNGRRRTETLSMQLAAGTRLELEILCIARGLGHPAITIDLATNASLNLIERHIALTDETLSTATHCATNLAVTIKLAAQAKLDLLRWHRLSGKTQHVETLDIRLGDGAYCELVQLTSARRASDTASSRSTAFVRHEGAGDLRWNAATLAEGQQNHDAYVRIEHAAPGAATRQMFRGIATGRGRIGFNGHMLVTAQASNARSEQSLKSLLAGSEAEANVRPQLEIYTDAVTATHGATVGKLDPDMLFYLLSRGLSPATAESLLKWAFISDVLARLGDRAARHEIEAALVEQLPGAVAARGEM